LIATVGLWLNYSWAISQLLPSRYKIRGKRREDKMNRTQALKQKTFDEQQWQKLYYRHQQQYLRNR
jgi:hypothetical protein